MAGRQQLPEDAIFTVDGASKSQEHSVNGTAEVDMVAEQVERPPTISNSQAMMHLMKGMIGTGILAIPSAIKNSGLWFCMKNQASGDSAQAVIAVPSWVGTIGLLFFGVICTHCMLLLVKSTARLSEKSGKQALDYTAVVKEAFSNGPERFRKFTKLATGSVNTFLCMTQYGFCCVYILFVGDNVRQVVEEKGGFKKFPVQFYSAIATILLMAVMSIRTLKRLTPVSMLANVLCAVGLIIILQYCVQGLKPIGSYPAFSSWSKLPLYFGTAVYAFEGIGVVLPIENRMRTPQDYGGLTGVLNTAMVTVTCLYTATGFYGYMKTYPNIQGSITLDLPTDDWLYLSVKLIFSVAIFCTYPLQFFVPHGIVWPQVKSLLSRFISNITYLHEYLFKVFIVVITFTLAAVIPHLDLMISLIGALASTGIALIFPVTLDLLIFYPEGRLTKLEVVKNVLILVFGIIGFIAGTSTAVYNIALTF